MGQLKRQLVMWVAIATTTAVLPGLALADLAGPGPGGGRHGRDDRHGRDHRHDDAKLSVAGRAISKGATDSYGLQIRGRSGDEPSDAGGMVRFAHRSENGMEGLVGEITCLSKDSAGVVSVSGTIVRSGKRKGAGSPAEDAASFEDFLSIEESSGVEPLFGRDGEGDRRGRRSDGEGDRRGRRSDGDRDGDRRGNGELAGKDFALTISVAGKPQKFSPPTIAEKGSLAACSGGGVPTAEVTWGGFRVRDAGADDEDARDSKSDNERDGRRGRWGWWR